MVREELAKMLITALNKRSTNSERMKQYEIIYNSLMEESFKIEEHLHTKILTHCQLFLLGLIIFSN